jgi:hypothetical protein
MDAIDLPNDLWEAFLDPETGEVLVMTEEDRDLLDEEEVDDAGAFEIPGWQKEAVKRLKALLDSGRALSLPDRFDFHEWEVMKRFALSIEDIDEGTELSNAIHGSGAFRVFKATIVRLGHREKWFEYRDEALRELAKEWLEDNGIEYTEEGATGGLPGTPRSCGYEG